MGTIAADTKYYPFGTKMYVPGYGWGVVADRGGDIKGPDRIDLFYNTHSQANNWGRQRVSVEIERP
jgi:3D (Asp-Asp-Asp) domain-containing protein